MSRYGGSVTSFLEAKSNKHLHLHFHHLFCTAGCDSGQPPVPSEPMAFPEKLWEEASTLSVCLPCGLSGIIQAENKMKLFISWATNPCTLNLSKLHRSILESPAACTQAGFTIYMDANIPKCFFSGLYHVQTTVLCSKVQFLSLTLVLQYWLFHINQWEVIQNLSRCFF